MIFGIVFSHIENSINSKVVNNLRYADDLLVEVLLTSQLPLRRICIHQDLPRKKKVFYKYVVEQV